MRRRLRFLILGIVLIAVGIVGSMAGRAIWRQQQAALLQKGLDLLPGVMQRLQNFRRVKVIDDHKVWEVAAEDAQYYEADHMIYVRLVTVQLYLDNGRSIGLSGREGRIYLEGKDVVRVDLDGGIEASVDEYKVKADKASYDQLKNTVTVPGAVQISGSGIDLTGEGMEIDVNSKTAHFLRQIVMKVVPGELNPNGGSHAPL